MRYHAKLVIYIMGLEQPDNKIKIFIRANVKN
jgi:hypothetical protein